MVRMHPSARLSVCGCWLLVVFGVIPFVCVVFLCRFKVNGLSWSLVIDFVCCRLLPVAEFIVLRIVSAVRVVS
jgi:hypothetical protein